MGRDLYNWAFEYKGSSRSSALIRISLAILLLYRFLYHPAHSMSVHGWWWSPLLAVSGVLMLVGFGSQVASVVAGLTALSTHFYFSVWLGDSSWAHHNTYFLGLAVLMVGFAPCGRSYSVDRLLAQRKADLRGLPQPREEGNLFALRLLAVQLAILYFFAFWDKTFIAESNNIYTAFLDGTRLEQILQWDYVGSDFTVQPWMHPIAAAMAITVAVLELVLPLLLFQRFRKWLVIPGLGLHLAFYVMLPLATYSMTCMVLYLALFDANWIHGLIDLIGPQTPPVAVDDAERGSTRSGLSSSALPA